jgi:hypothetical protein
MHSASQFEETRNGNETEIANLMEWKEAANEIERQKDEPKASHQ